MSTSESPTSQEAEVGNDRATAFSAGREAAQVLTEAELEQRLLSACNGLRGPVDPTDYKAYIFPLLFLKRISDKWEWEHRRALAKFDHDEELARLEENFQFVLPDGCHWSDVQKLSENVGAGLQKILQRIEQANPNSLAGIFGDVQWANKEKLPEPALRNVLKEFSALNLDPEHAPGDVLGAAYEYLLKYFADESGKKAGEFFTPRSVVRLLTLILDPKEGESVHDPTCGSGGMIVEMVNVVREHDGDPRTMKLSGQEVSLTTAAIARMNLFLHDIDDFRIRRGDTLRDPKFKTPKGDLEKFDIVIANPPFSLTPWGHDVWAEDPYGRSTWGTPPAQYGDLAFVEHMLSVMKNDGGRLAVVMPQGVLNRRVEQALRENVLKDGLLSAVILLPPNLFYNTGLPACVLVCKPVASRSGEVVFVDASSRFTKRGARNEMDENDVELVANAYKNAATPDDASGISVKTVTLAEIEENGWDLNPGLYLDGASVDVPDYESALSAYESATVALHKAEEMLARRLAQVRANG